ncbi:MAG TPA: hypothetical protein VFD50_01150 [Thermoleophilia bacterium]|jgi:hypothetical protein|nr:hypothetical protein [Thermoleophilia bacterium]
MTITINERAIGTRETVIAFSITVKEDKAPDDVASSGYQSVERLTANLLTVSKNEVGEKMTQEIESNPAEVATLRRARGQVKGGRVYGQEDLDKRIADQG